MAFQSLYINNQDNNPEDLEDVEYLDREENDPAIRQAESPEVEGESDEQEDALDSKTDYTADSITLHLNKLNKVPLLKREEEIALSQQIERGVNKSRKSLSRSLVVAAEIEKIAAQINNGTLTVPSVFEYPQMDEDFDETGQTDPRDEEVLTTLPLISTQLAKVRSLRTKFECDRKEPQKNRRTQRRWLKARIE